MAEPYISKAEAQTINEAFASLFATGKLMGETQDVPTTVALMLWRDSEEDGSAIAIPAQSVLVVMARREAAEQRGQASAFLGADGEFRKEPPFDVQENDRFAIPDGTTGRVGKIIAAGPYVRAAFVLGA